MLIILKKFSRLLHLTVAAAILSSCGSNQNADDSQSAADTTETNMDSSAIETEVGVTYILPSPLQIASIFKKSGLKYIEGLTNAEANINKYTTMHSKAINMGVYSADLAYCVLNKQTQQSLNYIKTVRQLGEQLGLGGAFENDLLKRFEKNMNNEDSLAYIVAELQMQTDMYLEENDQKHMTPVMFAGAWVESMYIAAKVNEQGKNKKIADKLSEQMVILSKIIGALKSYQEQNNDIKNLSMELEKIQAVYESAKPARTENEEDAEVVLTEDNLTKISAAITELRNKLING